MKITYEMLLEAKLRKQKKKKLMVAKKVKKAKKLIEAAMYLLSDIDDYARKN